MKKDIVLKLVDVRKEFKDESVISNISLEIEKGKVTCIIGPSGSGKTTLLKCMNLLELIDNGEIYFNNKLIISAQPSKSKNSWIKKIVFSDGEHSKSKRSIYMKGQLYRQKVGIVFQQFNLWPWKTVLENTILGPVNVKGMKKFEAESKAKNILRKVGIEDIFSRYPSTLSDGQIQRVSIARALMMGYDVLLLDEVTSALDIELVSEILEILRDLAKSGATLVIVTHHIEFAKEIADYIVVMDQGKIVEQGNAKNVLEFPTNPRTKLFLKHVLDAR